MTTPTSTPTPAPTEEQTAFFDAFDSFDSSIWYSQPSGITYAHGVMTVTGGDVLMRTINTFTYESAPTIESEIYKSYSCSDHIIMISTSSSASWSWGTTSGNVKFVWNCESS